MEDRPRSHRGRCRRVPLAHAAPTALVKLPGLELRRAGPAGEGRGTRTARRACARGASRSPGPPPDRPRRARGAKLARRARHERARPSRGAGPLEVQAVPGTTGSRRTPVSRSAGDGRGGCDLAARLFDGPPLHIPPLIGVEAADALRAPPARIGSNGVVRRSKPNANNTPRRGPMTGRRASGRASKRAAPELSHSGQGEDDLETSRRQKGAEVGPIR